MTIRKSGAKKENLNNESMEKLATNIKMMIRRDYGGHEHGTIVKKRLADRGINVSMQVCMVVDEIIGEVLVGCRKRISPRIDEIVRRSKVWDCPET